MRSYQRRGPWTFLAALGVFLFTVGLFVGMFVWYGRDETTLSLGREYYFLVRECEDATASAVAGQVYLSGGAGYLLTDGGRSCVVLSCYFRLTDAERVQGALAEKGIEAEILTLSTKDFSASAADKQLIEDNVATAETCARILYDAANGLERAEFTQDEARAAVRGAASSLKGLSQGSFPLWNAELVRAEHKAREICEGILFAKDLRYLEAELLLAIVRADVYFA